MNLSKLCRYVFFFCIILLCETKDEAKEVEQPMEYHVLSKKIVKRYNYNSSFLPTNNYSTIHNDSQDVQMKMDKIIELPGQPKVDFDQYGGYVTVDPKKGRALYYYFVESPQNSYSKPLLLWLNGGPGCSSLGYGAMMENGPFRVNKDGKTLAQNHYSWNKVANVLYVESPAGTGFSYSNTSSDYYSIEDDRTTTDLYTFIKNWLERFPQYKTRDFFIAGESYAGRSVPQLALHIMQNNKIKNLTTINLHGIAVGNPLIDYYMEIQESYKLFWSHALIPEDLYQQMKDCNFMIGDDFEKKCWDAYDRFIDDTGELDVYNIYAPLPDCIDPNTTSEIYNRDPCYEMYVKKYLNSHPVQKALHANVTNLSLPWAGCSLDSSNFARSIDELKPILPIIGELIAERLNIWIYSGDADSVVPTLATRQEIKLLELPIINEWCPLYYGKKVGGYVEQYKGLTFVTIRGAGHMVPMDQPEIALLMISYFLEMNLPLKT